MSKFGRWGASPNPVQRYAVGRPIFGAILFTCLLVGPFMFLFLVVTQSLPATALVSGVTLVGTFVASYSGGTSRTREEDFDVTAMYLPWYEWMPGWADSETLAKEEDARRRDKETETEESDHDVD